LEKNGLIQSFRYFSKITVPVRTGTIVIVPVRSLSLRTLHRAKRKLWGVGGKL